MAYTVYSKVKHYQNILLNDYRDTIHFKIVYFMEIILEDIFK